MAARAPLVSVVIPAWNAERFVLRTLRSAAMQSYPRLEILLVDDGSTDGTRAIAEAFAASDDRVRVIHTPNGGVARARNRGLSESRGEFIAFLDADDLWHPVKVEAQVRVLLDRDPAEGWAAVYTLHRKIDTEDRVVGQSRFAVAEGSILSRHLLIKYVGNGSSLMVRREAAVAVGGYDPSYADAGIGGCEDLDFELKLAARYRIAALRRFLVGYRCYEGNMSSNHVRMGRSMLEVTRRALAATELSGRVRRWIAAAAHHYAAGEFVEAGAYLEATGSIAAMAALDPKLAARFLMRRFHRSLAQPREPGRPFGTYHPDDSSQKRPFSFSESRMAVLRAEDRRLEAGIPSPIARSVVAATDAA